MASIHGFHACVEGSVLAVHAAGIGQALGTVQTAGMDTELAVVTEEVLGTDKA